MDFLYNVDSMAFTNAMTAGVVVTGHCVEYSETKFVMTADRNW